MKFLIVLALIAAASAVPLKRISAAEIKEIISAINSPSTNPATAAALQQMLHDLLGGLGLDDIIAGPALIEENEDIAVGPALVEEHEDISVDPALVEDQQGNSPFNFKDRNVQIFVNILNITTVAGPVTVDQNFSPNYRTLNPGTIDVIDGSKPDLIPDNVNIFESEIIPDPISTVENPKPELEVENINIATPDSRHRR